MSFEFAEFVTNLDHGRVNQRLTEELKEVVAAVQETNRVGKLAIVLTVKREANQAVVVVDSKPQVPRPPHHGTLFHFGLNEEGSLVRDDPRQLSLRQLPEQEMVDIEEEEEMLDNE
jgi:hypothetical protein